ncbi:hypothetical protein DL89DRAFT_14234 [Linderina pennispora]|uniref:Mid2 domain-containing protein n=1 Tax=Linderina pennispora TaxID=61395 RepID=A0A1Y1WLU1_9FUNG|nr:uncharacterized protein DL89DRAFT_14234 [Linderina pennispora]ORX74335.1 hypothetical protein DL89DRAFT_14234 [Linderina pennispora]
MSRHAPSMLVVVVFSLPKITWRIDGLVGSISFRSLLCGFRSPPLLLPQFNTVLFTLFPLTTTRSLLLPSSPHSFPFPSPPYFPHIFPFYSNSILMKVSRFAAIFAVTLVAMSAVAVAQDPPSSEGSHADVSSASPPPSTSEAPPSTTEKPPVTSSEQPPPTSSSEHPPSSTENPPPSSTTPPPPESSPTSSSQGESKPENNSSTSNDSKDTDAVTITSTTTTTSFDTTGSTSPTENTVPTLSGTKATTKPTPSGTQEAKSSGTPTESNSGNRETPKSGKGLSGGAIAGIVIAIVVVIGGIIGFLFWRRYQQKKQFAKNIDYNEFPEFDPSQSNPAVAAQQPPMGQANGYYSDKSNLSTPHHNGSVGPAGGAGGAFGLPDHQNQGVFLRDLDEA